MIMLKSISQCSVLTLLEIISGRLVLSLTLPFVFISNCFLSTIVLGERLLLSHFSSRLDHPYYMFLLAASSVFVILLLLLSTSRCSSVAEIWSHNGPTKNVDQLNCQYLTFRVHNHHNLWLCLILLACPTILMVTTPQQSTSLDLSTYTNWLLLNPDTMVVHLWFHDILFQSQPPWLTSSCSNNLPLPREISQSNSAMTSITWSFDFTILDSSNLPMLKVYQIINLSSKMQQNV
jgi:hypothetical protein